MSSLLYSSPELGFIASELDEQSCREAVGFAGCERCCSRMWEDGPEMVALFRRVSDRPDGPPIAEVAGAWFAAFHAAGHELPEVDQSPVDLDDAIEEEGIL